MAEMRKPLALAAAAIILLSIAFPHWHALLVARTYSKPLCVTVYPYKMAGDVHEWNTVGNLEGAKILPIPKIGFIALSSAFVGVALLSIGAAFRKEWLRIATLAPWLLLGGMVAATQIGLYIAGHSLDPHRALRHLEPFTPPAVGWVTIRTIVTYQLPTVGSTLLLLACVLLTLAAMLEPKVTSKPALI